MGFTNPPTFAPAQTVTAANWNTLVRDNEKALASKCAGIFGATFTAASGLTANIPCNSQLYDSADDMFNPAASGRITIAQAGTYRFVYEVGAPTGGGWTIFLKKNGTTTVASKTAPASIEAIIDFPVALVATDFIEGWVTVGGANVTAVAQLSRRPATVMVWISAEWVGP